MLATNFGNSCTCDLKCYWMSHNYMQVLITELIQIVMIRHTIILFVMSDLEFTMETDTQ